MCREKGDAMALRGFTVNEMVQVTGEMLDPGSAGRAALERAPLLAPLVPLLLGAHQGTMAALPRMDDPRAKALVAEATALDAVHDTLVRKIYDCLTSLAELAGSDSPYRALRDTLVPDGIAAATQITYVGEAGLARRVRARLTESVRQQLASIPVGARALLDIVNEWLDAGDRLGKLEAERNAVETEGLPSRGAINEARLRWIQVVNALRALAPLAELSTGDHEAIFRALGDLEMKADARSAKRTGTNIEDAVAEELESDPAAPVAASRARDVAARAAAAPTPTVDTSKVRTDLPGGSPFTDP